MCSKTSENRSTNSSRKMPGSDVTFFSENVKSLNILSKMLEIYVKCHKNLNEVKTFESSKHFCPDSKVHDHGLSPLLILTLFFGINILFAIRFSKVLLHILRQYWHENILRYHFEQKIIQKIAISEAGFSTLID